METITIPSPSAFLSSSPKKEPAKLPPPSAPPAAPRRKSSTPKDPAGVTKPKQSKSRNGCITCKAKRLKCDETKPSCQQCHKRNVTCGGYKKDFKWRPFEEATFTNKPTIPRQKSNSISTSKVSHPSPAESPSNSNSSPKPSVDPSGEGDEDASTQDTFFNAAVPSPQAPQSNDPTFNDPFLPPFDMSTPPYLRQAVRPRFEPDSVTSSLESLFDDANFIPLTGRPSLSGQSPKLIDLLIPGSDMNARPQDSPRPRPPPPPDVPFLFQSEMMNITDEDIEEIIRQPPVSEDHWMSFEAPMQMDSRSRMASPRLEDYTMSSRMYQQLDVQAGSPEMLMLRFDKQTCGILSVKDGPTENPWRTLVWPLARDAPALYHAIASMTAFHASKGEPSLRVDGMEHMRQSIRQLASGIDKMRTDTALATTLALAFSESWDQHISTGIEHLRGARILVSQALTRHNRRPVTGDNLARLKFLCNTWVYMDVIARLTSVDEDEITDFDNLLYPLYGPFGNQSTELDPLMGCASTLFPLIGRAANLCRRVRSAPTNSIAVISQANEIKEQIERWQAGADYDEPEDPFADIQHALQTAEAYRFATLLYLHQAVPEIPSLTSAQLAKKVLVFLATVPLSSRLVIVQIYPLLAAGCEAYDAEDRQWVKSRWESMEQRMWIGNIDKCWQVTQEVWRRRDVFELAQEQTSRSQPSSHVASMSQADKLKRRFEDDLSTFGGAPENIFSFEEMLKSNTIAPPSTLTANRRHRMSVSMGRPNPAARKRVEPQSTEEMDHEMTVRGSLHWVGVMKDWEWEVLLG